MSSWRAKFGRGWGVALARRMNAVVRQARTIRQSPKLLPPLVVPLAARHLRLASSRATVP
jgi:hypothetical protein